MATSLLNLNISAASIITKASNTNNQLNARRYNLYLKNIIDQKKFIINCKMKSTIQDIFTTVKLLLFFVSSVSIKYNAIPISMYNIVQTIGNKYPGGESGGLDIFSNRNIISLVK